MLARPSHTSNTLPPPRTTNYTTNSIMSSSLESRKIDLEIRTCQFRCQYRGLCLPFNPLSRFLLGLWPQPLSFGRFGCPLPFQQRCFLRDKMKSIHMTTMMIIVVNNNSLLVLVFTTTTSTPTATHLFIARLPDGKHSRTCPRCPLLLLLLGAPLLEP